MLGSLAGVAESGPWRQEVRNFVRAFSGAYLFGIPLLYTMEMWWLGELVETGRLLWTLGIALVANFGMAAAVGFRRGSSLYDTLEQTVDAMAVGIVGAAVVLLALNELRFDDPPAVSLAKVVVQALPLSLGASIANAIFGGRQGREGDARAEAGVWQGILRDMGATATGAVFVSATVAPTEEIPMLAARLDYPHLLAVIGLSLVIGYAIVFASGFDPQQSVGAPPLFQHPLTETTLAYLVSLLVSLGVLFVTQQLVGGDQPAWVLEQTLVLGLPAMIGGAAGRLAI